MLPNWSPEGVEQINENHDKTDFLQKCVMCARHCKDHTTLPVWFDQTITRPCEKGPENI